MSKSENVFNLTLRAFAPSPVEDIQLSKTFRASLYGKDQKLITRYSEIPSENEAFRVQFSALIDLFDRWGQDSKCHNESTSMGILKMKKNFFNSRFSSLQPGLYFERIKENLEKILITLQSPALIYWISNEKATQAYINLCKKFNDVNPEIYISIEATLTVVDAQIAAERWLADLRTSIINDFVNLLINNKLPGDRVQVMIRALFADAEAQKWNPGCTVGKIYDSSGSQDSLDSQDLLGFRTYFLKKYNPLAIRNWLQKNVEAAVNRILHQAHPHLVKITDWNSYGYMSNYMCFMGKMGFFLKEIGLESGVEEYLELDAEESRFRIRISKLVADLSETFIRPHLYYDPVKNQYVEKAKWQSQPQWFKAASSNPELKQESWTNSKVDEIFFHQRGYPGSLTYISRDEKLWNRLFLGQGKKWQQMLADTSDFKVCDSEYLVSDYECLFDRKILYFFKNGRVLYHYTPYGLLMASLIIGDLDGIKLKCFFLINYQACFLPGSISLFPFDIADGVPTEDDTRTVNAEPLIPLGKAISDLFAKISRGEAVDSTEFASKMKELKKALILGIHQKKGTKQPVEFYYNPSVLNYPQKQKREAFVFGLFPPARLAQGNALEKCTKNELFDRKVIGEIFKFL